MIRDWDEHFVGVAWQASKMGTCSRRQVGAVVVQDRHIVSTGFNGNAPNAVHCVDGGCSRCTSDAKSGSDLSSCVCVHAEQNAIAWCARYGSRAEGATVYTTLQPCLDCVRLMAVAGVTRVVYEMSYDTHPMSTPTLTIERWRRGTE